MNACNKPLFGIANGEKFDTGLRCQLPEKHEGDHECQTETKGIPETQTWPEGWGETKGVS